MKIRIRIDTLFCFGIFFFWAFKYPYHILFTEKLSLFLYTGDYWRQYALQPGGWAAYCGNFLSQFYINRWTGVLIQTLLMVTLLAITKRILKKTGVKGIYMLTAIFPALMLAALQVNYRFTPGDALRFICPFALTLAYMNISNVWYRRLAFVLATVPVFLFSGAAATCSLFVACVLYELFSAKDVWRFATPLWLVAVGFLPFIWQSVYLTPNDVLFAILAFPVVEGLGCVPYLLLAFIPFFILMIRVHVSANKLVFVCNILLLLGCGYYLFSKTNHRFEEQKFGMSLAVAQHDWDKVLKISKQFEKIDQHIVYCTNLALAMKGELPDKMFDYRQTDEYGLLFFHTGDFSMQDGSEFFYHIGILNEAIRWIFDANIVRKQGMDYHTLTRLAAWNRENGYERTAAKYFDVLEHTLMYRSWAKRQRQVPLPEKTATMTPLIEHYIGGREPIIDLAYHFDNHPQNLLALDYLLCGLLLKNNLEKFQNAFAVYYPYSSKIPKVYQEALLALAHQGKIDIRNYPIDKFIENHFHNFTNVVNKANEKELKKNFGNTWWYYSYRASRISSSKLKSSKP